MKTTSTLICAALLAGASGLALADQPGDTTRDQRIDAALADYRAGHPTRPGDINADVRSSSSDCAQTSDGGTMARAGAAMKRGACKTGHAIERGVKKTGHAIERVGEKTGNALRRGGEKMGGSPEKATSDPVEK